MNGGLYNLTEEYFKPGGCASFLLAPSMKNPPKVTSQCVRCSPRGTAAVTESENLQQKHHGNKPLEHSVAL